MRIGNCHQSDESPQVIFIIRIEQAGTDIKELPLTLRQLAQSRRVENHRTKVIFNQQTEATHCRSSISRPNADHELAFGEQAVAFCTEFNTERLRDLGLVLPAARCCQSQPEAAG